MGWLPFYAAAEDVDFLREWLNDENEIAFFVKEEPNLWITRSRVDVLTPLEQGLWHVPSGPLPLVAPRSAETVRWIDDPWAGWEELPDTSGYPPLVWPTSDGRPLRPWFGPSFVGTLQLNLNASRSEGAIALSGFQWVGNSYRMIGTPAHPTTMMWWQRLRRWMKKHSVLVPRGMRCDLRPEIWAMPKARDLLLRGTEADINP